MTGLRRFWIAGISAVLVTAVFLVYVTVTAGPTFRDSGSFNFSQTLPPGSASSSNPGGCGANATRSLSFPGGVLEYFLFAFTVNASGATVNYWFIGPNLNLNGSQGFGVTLVDTVNDSGLASHYTFTFQGCESNAGVPIGFWGYYQPYPIRGLSPP